MIRLLAVVCVVSCVAWTACEIESGDTAVDRGCDRLMQLCGTQWFGGDVAQCQRALADKEACRLGCLTEHAASCAEAESCVFGALENGDFVDAHCVATASDPDGPDNGFQGSGGVCYFQHNDGTMAGFGCRANVASEDACQAWVLERTMGGASLVQWDWMEECASIGCTGACGPDWWSLY